MTRTRRANSEVPFIDGGTVQVGNLAAKFFIEKFDGNLMNARFAIKLHMMTTGSKVAIHGHIRNKRVSIEMMADASGAKLDVKKTFRTDPELWVKQTIESALARSLQSAGRQIPHDLSGLAVSDGMVYDEADFGPTDIPRAKTGGNRRRTTVMTYDVDAKHRNADIRGPRLALHRKHAA